MDSSIPIFLEGCSAWFAALKDAAAITDDLPDLEAEASKIQDRNTRETTFETKKLILALHHFLKVMSKFNNARGITADDIKHFETLRAKTTLLDKMDNAAYLPQYHEQFTGAMEAVGDIVKLVDAIEARGIPSFTQTRNLTKMLLDGALKLVEGEPEDVRVGDISKIIIEISYAFRQESKAIHSYGDAVKERFVGAFSAYDLLCEPALAAAFEHTHQEFLAAREAGRKGNKLDAKVWEDDVAMGNTAPEPAVRPPPKAPASASANSGPGRPSSFPSRRFKRSKAGKSGILFMR